MAESMESLHRRGAISSRQMDRMSKPAILNKTKRGVPAKMTDFNSKAGKRDQGGVRDRGEVPGNEIDHRTNQRTGSPATASGLPSRGAQTRGGTEPKTDSINQRSLQKPDFPRGSKVKGNKKQVGVRGGVKPSAPSQYGGPSNRKYG